MINKYRTSNKDKRVEIDAIAEQWANLVLVQVQAKKLSDKKLINIKNKYEYARR